MHPGQHRARLRAAVLTTTAAVGLLLAWAASRGPETVLGAPTPAKGLTQRRQGLIHQVSNAGGNGPNSNATQHTIVNAIIAWLLAAFLLFAVLLTVVALARLVTWRPRRRNSRPRAADVVEDLKPIDDVAAAMRADAAAQEALLDEGSPRNAVVACWHRFEQQAEAARLARRPSETSSEFTLRLLDLVEADADAVARLAELYREARFSEHELDEADRDRARAALQTIHRQLSGLLAPAAG